MANDTVIFEGYKGSLTGTVVGGDVGKERLIVTNKGAIGA
jgi:hypothetical protein